MTRPNFDSTTLLVGGSILAGLLLWFFVLAPVRTDFNDIQGSIAAERTRLQEFEDQRTDPQAVAAERTSVTEKLNAIRQYFFSDAKALELFSQLDALADSQGVSAEFSLASEKSASATGEIELRFTISGPYRNTLTYLESLEHLQTIFIIDNVEMQAQGGNRISTSMIARVFSLESET
jgi:hypothetical protein